jgi:DNA-binding transcriptional LysR family regulator
MDMPASLRDLEVRHLIAFDAVAVEGTFGRAAERLGYTQSAISQQIAALERVVDGKLFDRPGGPKPVELTPLGVEMLDAARDLLNRVEAANNRIERFRSGEVGSITVGTFQSTSAAVLPTVIGRLRERFPAAEVRIFETDHDFELFEGLQRGDLDLSFVVGEVAPGLDARFLMEDPLVLVSPIGRFECGPVALADLDDEPVIGQHANSCQLTCEMGLRELGMTPNYVFRTNDNGTVAAMVRAGMGVAYMPLLCVEPYSNVVDAHVTEPPLPPRTISMAWRAGRTISPLAEHFVEVTVEVCADLEFQRQAMSLFSGPVVTESIQS